MAKNKIVHWTHRAIFDKIEILEYWIDRNKSKAYSIKLDLLFDEAVKLASTFPEAGKKTDYKSIRIKVVRHYLIYYLITDDRIEIIRIMDPRKGDEKFSP